MSTEIKSIYKLVDQGNVEEVRVLLDDMEGSLAQHEKDELLLYCLDQRRPAVAHEVLMIGGNPDCTRGEFARPLLSAAIASDQMEEAVLLVAVGANVNATDLNGDTPAHFAARQDAPGILALLYRNGCDLDVANLSGKTPSALATENHNESALAYFSTIKPVAQSPRRRVSM